MKPLCAATAKKIASRIPSVPGFARGFAAIFAGVVLILTLAGGCATPGQPIERTAKIPAAITDLAATQTGNVVELSFHLPAETTRGQRLAEALEVDIYRRFAAPGAEEKQTASSAPLLIIPPQMLPSFEQQGQVSFSDHLSAQQIAENAGSEAIYSVRTREGGELSEPSNTARIRILPAPPAPENLRAAVSASGVELRWSASPPPANDALPLVSLSYIIFRAEALEPDRSQNGGKSAMKPPSFAKIGQTSSPEFQDAQIRFGGSYIYYVTAQAQYKIGSVESAKSSQFEVIPRDTFRPPAPTNVAAVFVPTNGTNQESVDLSWSFGSVPGIAGYNVYRSETESTPGERLNQTLLPSAAYRDVSVQPPATYFYRVSAVDNAGNESAPSSAVSVTIPKD